MKRLALPVDAATPRAPLVPLGLQIGWFLLRAPARMRDRQLPVFLRELRVKPRPRFADIDTAAARIARLRRRWLRQPWLRRRNTCYLRALTLFRFLDVGDRVIRFHMGIEPAREGSDHPHSHAWVSVDDQLYEVPTPLREGRVKEIYVFSDSP